MRGAPTPRRRAATGEVFPGTGTQVTEDLAVAGLAAERGVGKIRAQFDQLAPGRVLARDGHALRRELLVVIAVEDVGDLDAAVQVIERAAAGLGDDMRRKFRDRVAAVDMQPGQVGTAQIHRKVVTGHRVVEVDHAEEIEIEVGVAGRDTAVELAVAKPPVEAQRIVDIAVEAQLRDIAHYIGVGDPRPTTPSTKAVSVALPSRSRRPSSSPSLRLRAATSPLTLLRRRARAHLQVTVNAAHVGLGTHPHVERREQPAETGVDVDVARIPEDRDQLVGKRTAADARSQGVDGFGRGGQARNRQVRMRRADVGQPLTAASAVNHVPWPTCRLLTLPVKSETTPATSMSILLKTVCHPRSRGAK